jgi:hypothetical protein
VAALKEASTMLDRAAQALKDWRLHAKALTDYQEGKMSLAEARRRWAKTTKVGLAGADRSTSKPRSTRRRPPPVGNGLLHNRCCGARFGGMQLAWRWPSRPHS